jgi:hypothetical protein
MEPRMILLASLVTDDPSPVFFGVACLWVALCAAVAALVKLQSED